MSQAHTNAFLFENAYFFDAFSPIVHTATIENADHFHRKRIHLKTLSRVETFENGAFRKRSQTKTHQCGRRKRRLSKTLTSFVYLSHAQMTIVEFSSDKNAVVWPGKCCENDSVDGCVFGKNGAKGKRISVDGAFSEWSHTVEHFHTPSLL